MMLLKDLRERAGRTQEDVVRDLGLSRSTVHRHETGKKQIRHVDRIAYAAYYGVNADQIEQPDREEEAA